MAGWLCCGVWQQDGSGMEKTADGWLDGESMVAEAPGDHGDDTRLWLRLLTCSTLMENEIRRRLREEFDSTLPRFDLLAQLERAHHGMVLGELSKRMMVSAGNLTALVDRLVESGHVSRTTSPADRRVQIVALTDYGRDWFRTVAKRHGDWLGGMFSGLGAREREALLAALGKLKDSVRRSLADD
jgi:DNA-binding MarR family transcriptional regulator